MTTLHTDQPKDNLRQTTEPPLYNSLPSRVYIHGRSLVETTSKHDSTAPIDNTASSRTFRQQCLVEDAVALYTIREDKIAWF